jgi:hypothetical protein
MRFAHQLRFLTCTVSLLIVTLLSSCGSVTTTVPNIDLQISSAFNHKVTRSKFKTGDYLVNSPPYIIKAKLPTARIEGEWGNPTPAQHPLDHRWRIDVESTDAKSTADAIAKATSGYDAGVNTHGNYMFARFERKQFKWGKTISFLSQFTDDTGGYVPNNGSLTYEVWGTTTDNCHIVHLTCSITHRALEEWGPKVRTTRSMKELHADKDFKLVETCASSDFEPALPELDRLLDTLVIKDGLSSLR